MSTVIETTEAIEALEVPTDLSPRRMLEGLPPEMRVIVADVAWDLYERMVDSVREGENCRLAYDGKDIEMMSIGVYHDAIKSRVDDFIGILAGELLIDHEAVGSATWKRKNVERGIEPDLSYYFESQKLAIYATGIARQSNVADDYPNPDLAVEIDISEPRIDRTDIYSKLQVPEIWPLTRDQSRSSSLGHQGLTSKRNKVASCPYGPRT